MEKEITLFLLFVSAVVLLIFFAGAGYGRWWYAEEHKHEIRVEAEAGVGEFYLNTEHEREFRWIKCTSGESR
jgi:hypothetical protein